MEIQILDARQQAAQSRLETLVTWCKEQLTWPNPDHDKFALLMGATMADVTRTSAAAAILTRDGYGIEALKLSRSIVEATVIAFWAVHGPNDREWIQRRIADYDHFNKLMWLKRLRTREIPPELRIDADTRARFEATFGTFGEVSWWAREVDHDDTKGWQRGKNRSLRSLIKDLESASSLHSGDWQRWTEPGDATWVVDRLRYVMSVPQNLNNQLLHHSPTGLSAAMSRSRDGVKFVLGPSSDWLAQAITLIYQQLMLMAILTTTVFRRDLTESLEQVLDVKPFLTLGKLDKEEAEYARRNRNKPCPCGSGFKSKKCHAASLN